MTTIPWKQYATQAAANSGGPTLPEGSYTGEIIDAGSKPIKDGRPRFWWKFKILVGPHAGDTEIMSQIFSPDNEKARNIFFWQLSLLGIDFANVADGATPESIAKLALGKRFNFNFSHRTDKGKTYAQFNDLVEISEASAPQAPAAPPVPEAPVTAPVTYAPVTEAPVAPAPEVQPDVAALQAQLAALQAAQAAPAAPAAEAAPPAAPAAGALPF